MMTKASYTARVKSLATTAAEKLPDDAAAHDVAHDLADWQTKDLDGPGLLNILSLVTNPEHGLQEGLEHPEKGTLEFLRWKACWAIYYDIVAVLKTP